ncbi:MBL fold metallo-hydrolase [Corynebacterium mendelii]|uniref:MBL fold metallo-hydrolase n=1 Tax=Corynebacterium mendelii TaxID=2765362 RepID=A0A939E2M5_9CORY|nr:MBL fold metallo-hydrolase [Corynebacterium mendelii]MBN9644566.1 MBL fold metallo-hydrolase [Corynebacterium mendelii]
MTHEIRLDTISVSEMDNNVYLLSHDGEGLLIDAADDAPAISSLISRAGVEVTCVATTHRHNDHVRALKEVLDSTGAVHVASRLDAPALPAPVDHELDHGDVLHWAGLEIPVIVLRGHTPGGLVLDVTIDGVHHLFTGDSLFPGGVGKTTGGNDFTRLLNDVVTRVFTVYPDDTVVHPGHGAPTTLGAERPQLDQWRERGW